MAIDNEKASVTLNLDIAQSEKALKDLQASLKQLAEAKRHALTADEKNALANQIKETKDRVVELKTELRSKVDLIIDGKAAGVTLGNLEKAQRQLYQQLKNELVPGTHEYNIALEKYRSITEKVTEANSKLKGGGGGLHDFFDKTKEKLLEIGTAIGLAFGVEKIIEFGKESVDAFKKSEVAAQKLEFAIKNIAHEGDDAVVKLKELAERLSSVNNASIFSPRQIEEAQSQLAVFGLTSAEIEKLLPNIINMASVNGDLATTTESSLRAIEGQTRGLKTLGIDFKDTGDKLLNYNKLIDESNKLNGEAATVLGTAAGQAQAYDNRIEVLQESLGSKLAPALNKTKEALLEMGLALITAFQSDNSRLTDNLKEAQKKQIENFTHYGEGMRKAAIEMNEEDIKQQEKAIAANKIITDKKWYQSTYAARKAAADEIEIAKIKLANAKQLQEEFEKITNGPAKKGQSVLGLTDAEKEKRAADEAAASKKSNEAAQKAATEKLRIAEEIQRKLLDLKTQGNAALALLDDDANKRELDQLQAKYDEDSAKNLDALHKDLADTKYSKEQKAQLLAAYQQVELALDEKYYAERKRLMDKQAAAEEKAAEKSKQTAQDAIKAVTGAAAALADGLAKAGAKAAKDFASEFKNGIDSVNQYLGELNQAVSARFAIQANKDNAAYNHEQFLSNKRKKLLDSELKSKLISQESYDEQTAKLDEKSAEDEKAYRLKQFEREKKAALFSAIIQGALAVARAIATPPVPNIGLAAATGIAEGLQIAAISSQKAPELGDGGEIPGDISHTQGGLNVVDPRTGRIYANIESREKLISRAAYAANPQLVDSIIAAGGKRVVNTQGVINGVQASRTGSSFGDVSTLIALNSKLIDEVRALRIEHAEQMAVNNDKLETANNQRAHAPSPDPFAAYRNFEKVQQRVIAARSTAQV